MWVVETLLQPGSWGLLSIPFVTTLTPLSHFPQLATFLSASQQLPSPPGVFPRGSPGSQGSGFPVLSHSAPNSKARSGLQKRTQAKWGSGLGPWRGRCWPESKATAYDCLHLSPNSTPNTPRLPSLPRPHLTFWGSLCLTTRKHSSPSWGPGPAWAYLSDSTHACSQWSGRRNNELVQYNRKLVW